MSDTGRPACYPAPAVAARLGAPGGMLPSLDVLASPVPSGRFDSPVDHRHVLCLHLGEPVPVTYRAGSHERRGTRVHGQFCVVPAGSSTRWTLSNPATSLLLRLAPTVMREAAQSVGHATADLAPAIHIRDPQIERIGWLMQAENDDGYPAGRLFADGLACALATRLLALQRVVSKSSSDANRALPAWRLQRVIEYIEAHLDRDLSLAELATVAGFSVSHFKPLFKNATGMTAHRFVMERRVERARVHLMQRDASISDVAALTGFAHASHLARCMRRVLGVTPAQIAAESGRLARN
ncbi:helix-turn-helix domain-containing protein [Lysobacter sp. HA35]